MRPREALDELAAFVASGPRLEVATVAEAANGSAPDSRVLNLANDAEAFFREVVERVVEHSDQRWALKALDPIYKAESDVVEWSSAANVPAIQLALSRHANLGPLQPFDPSDDGYKRRLRYWTCILTNDGTKAYFFRAFSRTAELKRKTGAALVLRNGTFTKVEDHVFLFDEAIDCMVFNGVLFVVRKREYRRLFDQLDAVRLQARQAAAALHSRVPIANFDAFADACASQAGMADKLLAVQRRPYFRRLTYTMLKPVIDEFTLDIDVNEINGRPHLVFRTEPDRRWGILRLVDDDYLKSAMTDEMYEANSKTEHRG